LPAIYLRIAKTFCLHVTALAAPTENSMTSPNAAIPSCRITT
jgi:hypothetical protein